MDKNNLVKNENKYEDEIDLSDIFIILMKNKFTILVCVILCLIFSFLGGRYIKKKQTIATTIISLNFPEINQGKLPDGSSFNKENLFSSENLKESYLIYSKGLESPKTFSEFRENISIDPIVPNYITSNIKKSLEAGEKKEFFPSEFIVTLKVDESKEKDIEILGDLLNSTIQDFEIKYRPKRIVSKIDNSILNSGNYTYEELLKIIRNKINSIKTEISNDDNKKKNYLSKTLGYSFQNIVENLDLISDVDINYITSDIYVNIISNNIIKDKVVYEKKLKDLKNQKEQLIFESENIKVMIDEYKMNPLIISTSQGTEVSEHSNDHYSQLIDKYLDVTNNIKIAEIDIVNINHMYENLRIATTENDIKIKPIFENIIENINIEVSRMNEINKEYYERDYSSLIVKTSPLGLVYKGKSSIIFLAIGGIVGLILGICIVFMREFIKGIKKR